MKRMDEMTEQYLQLYEQGDYDSCLILLEQQATVKNTAYYRLKGELEVEKKEFKKGLRSFYQARELASTQEEKDALSSMIVRTQLDYNEELMYNKYSLRHTKSAIFSITSEAYQEEKKLLSARILVEEGNPYQAIEILKRMLPTQEQQSLYYQALVDFGYQEQATQIARNLAFLETPHSFFVEDERKREESLHYVACDMQYFAAKEQVTHLLEQGKSLVPFTLEYIEHSDLEPYRKELLDLKVAKFLLKDAGVEDLANASTILNTTCRKVKHPLSRKRKEELQLFIKTKKKTSRK